MSQDVTLRINAEDNASSVMQDVGTSTKDLLLGFSNLANASFGLYNSFDNVNDSEVSLDRANLSVQKSQTSLTTAQQDADKTSSNLKTAQDNLAEAIEKYGSNSSQAQTAQKKLDDATQDYKNSVDKLSNAQDSLKVSEEKQQQAQDNVNKSMVSAAIQVVPSVIGILGNMGGAVGTLSGILGTCGSITDIFTLSQYALGTALNFLSANPIVAVVIAIGLIVAGLVAAYNACPPFRDAVNALGSILGGAFSAAIKTVTDGLQWLWNNILKPIASFVAGTLLTAWGTLSNGIKWFYDNVMKPVFDTLEGVYNTVLKPIGDFLSGVGSAIGGALGLGGSSSNSSTIGSSGPSTKQAQLDQLMVEMNTVDSQLEAAKKQYGAKSTQALSLQNVLDNLKNQYSQIQAMAAGGIVTKPTVALIGEAGPEAVVPLSAAPSSGIFGTAGGSVSISIPITIQGSADRATIEAAKNEMYNMLQNVVIENNGSTSRLRVKSTSNLASVGTR